MRDFQAPATIQKDIGDFLDGSRPEDQVRKAWGTISPLLIPGENVQHLLVQGMTAIKIHPGLVVLTNRRAIFAMRGLMKMSFSDLLWRNLHGAHLFETMTGGELVLQDTSGRTLRMGHLPKEPSRRAYAYAQQLEEAAFEFRRQLSMEESRAAAKGFAFSGPSAPELPLATRLNAAPVEPSPLDALSTLNEMKERGLIDEDTYQSKRNEILARL